MIYNMNTRISFSGLCARFFCVFVFMSALLSGCADWSDRRHRTEAPKWSQEGGLMTSGQFRGLCIEDLDNDGNLDVVGGASSPGTVVIWYGDGTGVLSNPQYLAVQGDVRAVAVGDFDENGLKDIALSIQRDASGVMVWMNNPDHKWKVGLNPIEVNNYEGLEVADVNNDGHLDILAANSTSDLQGGVQVWLGDGKGRWPLESGPTITGKFMDVITADVNSDGKLDIVGAGWGTFGFLKVWFGDGAGDWAASKPIAKGDFFGLSIDDLNGDGFMDILAGSHKSGIQIYHGNGNGGFAPQQHPEYKKSFWKVMAIDIDGDGRKDLIGSSLIGEGIGVWKRTTSLVGHAILRWDKFDGPLPDSGTYYEIILTDLDKDGLTDICAASFGEGIKVWLGKEGTAKITTLAKDIANLSIESESYNYGNIKENNVFVTNEAGLPEYKIGPGDTLTVTLWKGTTGEKEDIIVRADGKISFGFVEDLKISKMTTTQLDDKLTELLKKYIKYPKLDVIVKQFRSKYVRFSGEVLINPNFKSGPGKYELDGKTSILEKLAKAGGPTVKANMRDVRVRRANGQSFNLNLYKAMQGDTSQDMVLDDDDFIFLPTLSPQRNRVYIFGQIAKPGVYPFKDTQLMMFDAISQAGGYTLFAKPQYTRIVRGDPTRPQVLNVDLKRLLTDGDQTQNIGLVNGDLVYVPRSFMGDVNSFLQKVGPLINILSTPARIKAGIISVDDTANDPLGSELK